MGNTFTSKIWGAFDTGALIVEEAQVVAHKAQQPHLLGDLLDANVRTGEDAAEVDLATVEADPPAARDREGAIVEGIFQLLT